MPPPPSHKRSRFNIQCHLHFVVSCTEPVNFLTTPKKQFKTLDNKIAAEESWLRKCYWWPKKRLTLLYGVAKTDTSKNSFYFLCEEEGRE